MNSEDKETKALWGLTPEKEQRVTRALKSISEAHAPVALKHRLLHPEYFAPAKNTRWLRAAKFIMPALALLALAIFIPDHEVPESAKVAIQTNTTTQDEELQVAALIDDEDLVDEFALDILDSELDIIEEVI